MRCPFCGYEDSRVVDSRPVRGGRAIWRRRECLRCQRRFTTYEEAEAIRLMVIKRDGRREPFDRNKLYRSLAVACNKRPVDTETLERIVETIERTLYDRGQREVPSRDIGDLVMSHLRMLDPVAFVRYASVYVGFERLEDFQWFLSRQFQHENNDDASSNNPRRGKG